MTSDADIMKHAAATAALSYVEPGMRLGLGTGSTAKILVDLIGAKVAAGALGDLFCVPTSSRTKAQAEGLGVHVGTLEEAGRLDLTIDGADEFDPDLNLIKGAGGALLQEKIVATASDRMIVIADPSKQVATLGAFALPVEVTPFGLSASRALVERVLADADVDSAEITLRMAGGAPYVTDEGNHILDLHLGRIGAPAALAAALNMVPGLVETGLFIGIADTVLVGLASGEADVIGLMT
ncbi:MAG: ribose-5-phosphate isomerase RpiA [Pseudomonadota bacterium]